MFLPGCFPLQNKDFEIFQLCVKKDRKSNLIWPKQKGASSAHTVEKAKNCSSSWHGLIWGQSHVLGIDFLSLPALPSSMLVSVHLVIWVKQPQTLYLLMNKVQQEKVSFFPAKLLFHVIGSDWATCWNFQQLLWPVALSALISKLKSHAYLWRCMDERVEG